MDSAYVLQKERGGFDFSLHHRNFKILQKIASSSPSSSPVSYPSSTRGPLKTGTTICGVICDGGVVLAADTRATQGPIVADKYCNKLHRISDNIYCAGAGVAADLDHMCDWLASQVELHRLHTGSKPRVGFSVCVMAKELFNWQGYRTCAIVLGGCDIHGPSLYRIHPHGSTDCSNFAAMGSGSLNAMTILEAGYRDKMSIEEGKLLAANAIQAGIIEDLGSGSQVDICVITPHETLHTRKFMQPACRVTPPLSNITFKKGTTPIIDEKVEYIIEREDDVEMVESSNQ